jgi:hypothetical protein
MSDLPDEPDFGAFDDDDSGGEELFESERNLERMLDYLDLMDAADIEQTGSFEEDNQAVHFTVVVEDPPQQFRGFAAFVKDAWVDICLLRDWSPDVRLKFRDRAGEIMNTLGLHGVSLYFIPDEDTLYMCHRVFTEGLNYDVFRACVWSLLSAQSKVAGILDRER